jgi:GNAT superfamily N-acetyltransferase
MSVKFRKYNVSTDSKAVGDFLVRNYLPENRDGNFFQPAWEYMHNHPMLDDKLLGNIGIGEDEEGIAAVVHYESTLGEAFFEIRRDSIFLKPQMLEYAENNLFGKTPEGRRFLHVFVNDFDKEFEALAKSRGYTISDNKFLARPMSQLKISQPFPPISVPDGFLIKSLVEEDDLYKIDRVMFRGFNHGDEPLEPDISGRAKMQSGPNFRKDLNIIVVAPDGNYGAYAGTWFETTNKFCYIEPVCTDPKYRRLGLGKAAVLEGIRRCGKLGATVAYVGSDQPFYLSFGFKKLFTSNCWIKHLD